MLLSHGLRTAGKIPELIYRQSAIYGLDSLGQGNPTNYTFTSQNIGAASSDRLVVVAISSEYNSARTFSSCTIGGVTASVAISDSNNSSESAIAAICYLNVTSGTTADIAVTMSGATTSIYISVYTITGLRSFTPVATVSSKASTGTGGNSTISVESNGVIIMSSAWRAAVSAVTYTGMSSSSGDNLTLTDASHGASSASNSKMAANASTTIGASATASSDYWCWAAASWR